MYSERERDNADDQETPGDKLVPGKRVSKPVIHIQKKKGKDELESKEPEKAVGTPIAEWPARDVRYSNGYGNKDNCFNNNAHHFILAKKIFL